MPNRGDLLVFLAILTAGVILVVVAHMPTDGLAAFAVGLAALYAAWKHDGKDGKDSKPD